MFRRNRRVVPRWQVRERQRARLSDDHVEPICIDTSCQYAEVPREFGKFVESERGVDRYLRQNPTRTSKSRIKRLRGMAQPQFRLRVGEIRVFYDAAEQTVQVLAIIGKEQASAWLEESGTPTSDRGAREDEG